MDQKLDTLGISHLVSIKLFQAKKHLDFNFSTPSLKMNEFFQI